MIDEQNRLAVDDLAALILFLFQGPATTVIYTLSLHDALPISCPPAPGRRSGRCRPGPLPAPTALPRAGRSEEHTSELQSRFDLVCRLLLEKKKKKNIQHIRIE